ncbi:hypothetical protein F0Z19_3954 [Vibrio cyclitrophicus]|nr:hypothetical protein F0Z19_3954 [Vibrio cyclitrophicus]
MLHHHVLKERHMQHQEMIQHSNFGVISRTWIFSTLSLLGILALM